MTTSRTVEARLRISTTMAAGVVGIHLLSGLAVCLADVPLLVKAGIALLACGSLRHAWRHDVVRSASRAVVMLSFDGAGRWTLGLRDGTRLAVRPAAGSVVHPDLSLLVWQGEDDGRRRHVVLPADALDAHAYRRVRIALRDRPPRDGRRRAVGA